MEADDYDEDDFLSGLNPSPFSASSPNKSTPPTNGTAPWTEEGEPDPRIVAAASSALSSPIQVTDRTHTLGVSPITGAGSRRSRDANGSWSKRWRVKAHEFAFVIEANVDLFDDPLNLRATMETGDAGDGDFSARASTHDMYYQDLKRKGPPQLHINRSTSNVKEYAHSSDVPLRERALLGHLQCVVQVMAFLGIISVKTLNFLVLVVNADEVALIPPDCSPLSVIEDNVDASKPDSPIIMEALKLCKQYYPPERYIYGINCVLLVPFNIPTDVYLSIKLRKNLLATPGASGSTSTRNFSNSASNDPSNRGTSRNRTVSHSGGTDHSDVYSNRCEQPDGSTNKTGSRKRSESRHSSRRKSFVHGSELIPKTLEDLLGTGIASLITDVEKTFSKRTFFFTYDMDITRSLQSRYQFWKDTGILDVPQGVPIWTALYGKRDVFRHPPLLEYSQDRFVWNKSMCEPITNANVDSNWLVPCIQGSVNMTVVNLGMSMLRMCLIGRRSSARGGTRYYSRGTNDLGDVSNFCESEFLSCTYEASQSIETGLLSFPQTSLSLMGGGWTSFLQIRGSVPLFWEQSSYGLNPQPRLTRTSEASQTAFIKHQRRIESIYGTVYYMDLLSSTKQGEARLSQAMQKTLTQQKLSQGTDLLKDSSLCEACNFEYFHWDFHRYVQSSGFEEAMRIFSDTTEIQDIQDQMGYFYVKGPKLQKGIFRTNCLDCLDRTNVIQWFLGFRTLQTFLNQHNGSNILRVKGSKYSYALYNWLEQAFSSLEDYDNFRKLVKSTEPQLRPVMPLPLLWDHHEPMLLRSPFPAAASNPKKHDEQGTPSMEEYDTYFLGGWGTGGVTMNIYVAPRFLDDAQRAAAGSAPPTKLWSSLADEGTTTTTNGGRTEDDNTQPKLGVPITVPSDQRTDVSTSASTFVTTPLTMVLKDAYSSMWANLGDLISLSYTGTASVLTPLMKSGKATLLTNLAHIRRSVGRFYKHNFEDRGRQDCFDIILGQHIWSDARPMTSSGVVDITDTTTAAATGKNSSLWLSNEVVAAERTDRLLTKEGLTPLLPSSPNEPKESYTLRLWIGTWNAGGGTSIATEDLTPWLAPMSSIYSVEDVDLYCVCLQEIVDLSGIGTMLNQVNRSRESEAIQAIREVLGESFVLLSARTMVGLQLLMFVKKSLRHEIRDIETAETKMGYMGQIGNKGAVIAGFNWKGRSWCFSAAHFAPDKFSDKSSERLAQIGKLLSVSFSYTETAVKDHDYIIIGGDFNFPAMAQISEVESWLEGRNFYEFFRRDQLSWLMSKHSQLFENLQEARVAFWPTYKYRPGSSTYDRKRPPSWCDRILFGGRLPGANFKVIKYDRIRSIESSDHKPVFILLEISESCSSSSTAEKEEEKQKIHSNINSSSAPTSLVENKDLAAQSNSSGKGDDLKFSLLDDL